jgi:hypothetical protein
MFRELQDAPGGQEPDDGTDDRRPPIMHNGRSLAEPDGRRLPTASHQVTFRIRLTWLWSSAVE